MAQSSTKLSLHLGFLTVLREASGYQGGYLVTNQWGRPLEFRLSTAVQPNRVQQILYAETLEPYVCGDLIGKTLVEKTGVPVEMVVTDTEAALDLRQRVEVPVIFLHRPAELSQGQTPAPAPAPAFQSHARFPADESLIQRILEQIKEGFDLAEPFHRIREAMSEARKLGATTRA